MRYLIIIFFGIFTLISLTSCPRKMPPGDTSATASVLEKDFNMVAAPNALDTVGYIFAVNKKKEKFPISYLEIASREGRAEIRDSDIKRTITFRALANFIGAKSNDFTANTGIYDSTEVNIGLSFSGASFSRGLLLDLDKKIQANKAAVINLIKNQRMEDHDFYLIVEVFKAKKINYSFSKDVLGNASLTTKFKKIADVDSGLSWDSDRSSQLTFDLSEPLVIFFKAFPLNYENSITGKPDLKLSQKAIVGKNGMLYE